MDQDPEALVHNVEEIVEKACSYIKKNPRSLGYITREETMKQISNLKEHKIWDIIHADETLKLLPKISKAFNINIRNLRNWRNQLLMDRTWLPMHIKDPDKSNVFTSDQLDNLANIINHITQTQNVIITNQLVKNLSIAYYKNLTYHPQPNLKFSASSHFISAFKKKYKFSTRRLHPKRRPTAKQKVIDNFLIKAKRIFRNAEPSHIVNADESFWRCMEYHYRTWAPTNSSNVLIHTEGSEKSGFTALATVARDGNKFPLILIPKGTTVKSESSWFGSGRSLNVRGNQIPEALPNPYFNDTSSRFSSQETITPESLTDHSPK